MIKKYTDRIFRVWDYSFSHDRFLIRSPKLDDSSFNVDLKFWGVDFISLNTMIRNPIIYEKSDKYLDEITQKHGAPIDPRHLTVFVSNGEIGYVLASQFKIEENNMNGWESPFDTL